MPHTFIAGVDLGATNVRVAVANSDGEIEARRSMPFEGGAPEDVLRRISRTIDELVRGVWVGASAAAIGIALPGTVDPDRGTVASAANLSGWGDVSIADILGARLGTPVAVENDANAAAIGEQWLGAAKGMRDFVFIALGTGIGGGVVIDGRLHRGAHLLAGEVAFFPMTADQLRAPGWQNCLEGVASGRAAATKSADLLGTGARTADLFDAARTGNADASAWLRQTQEFIAMATANIVALLDPEAVIFGGGMAMTQGEWFIEPIRDLALACTPARPKIVLSQLGEDAQLYGAIKLALDRAQRNEAQP